MTLVRAAHLFFTISYSSICYCRGESGIHYDTALRVVFEPSLPSIVTRPCSSFLLFPIFVCPRNTVRQTPLANFTRLQTLRKRTAGPAVGPGSNCDEAGCALRPYSSVVEEAQPKLGFDKDRVLNCDAYFKLPRSCFVCHTFCIRRVHWGYCQ